MKQKILIAPNSFKEVADSDKAAALFSKYLNLEGTFETSMLPVSDGGDGFLSACREVFNLEMLSYNISTPYDESRFDCEAGYDREAGKIYIESARVLGLRIIPQEHRIPLTLSSKGLGDMFAAIKDDVEKGLIVVDEVVIGVGGTGTSDLGLGVCSRFGLELYDIFGKKDRIVPEYYYRIKDIKWEEPELPFRIKTIVDVENPLLGRKGAARIFGPQKGADKGEVEVMELGFTKIVNILKNKELKRSFDALSGAGGGLAAGLHLFFNASSIKADEFIKTELKLEDRIDDFDIILTGEGNFDEQTLNGKGAGIVLRTASEHKKRVILCCGIVEDSVKERLEENVDVIELTSLFSSKEESIKNFEKGIELASGRIKTLL